MRLLIFILTSLLFFSCKNENSKYVDAQDIEKEVFVSTHLIPDTHFLGDEACASCHKEQFKDWKGSHHDKAMDIATDATVLGDFNDIVF